jgi:hypothetical protein
MVVGLPLIAVNKVARADEATLRGQRAMEIRETYCNKGVLDISSQRQLY